ncbi:MAG: NlpC/P60 family protein [Sphingobacteriales bacterium]|nr:MAG: NlpC/P60 family protein [Sphingobacteriales bacterium]
MQKFIIMLSAAIFATTTLSFAQDAPRNSRIASAEAAAEATESRFIEGISFEAPLKRSNTTTTAPVPTNNTRTTAKKTKSNNIRPEFVEEEPAPSFRDKNTAKNKLVEGIKRSPLLYGFIEEWYGTPYRMGGTTKKSIDCSAFTRQLFSDVYGKSLDRTAAMQFMMTKRIFDKEDLKEGDLVFFSIKTKRISHVGVYLGAGKFVHASSSRGVIISELDQAYWSRYYSGGGRL